MCAWWIGDLLRNWLLSERVVGRKTSSWRHGWVYEQALKSESVYEQSAASCLTPQSRSTFARHMLCLSPADGYGPLRGVHQHDTVTDSNAPDWTDENHSHSHSPPQWTPKAWDWFSKPVLLWTPLHMKRTEHRVLQMCTRKRLQCLYVFNQQSQQQQKQQLSKTQLAQQNQ